MIFEWFYLNYENIAMQIMQVNINWWGSSWVYFCLRINYRRLRPCRCLPTSRKLVAARLVPASKHLPTLLTLHEKTSLQIFTLVVKVSKGIIKIRLNFTLTLLNVKLLFTLHLLQYKETDYLYLSLRLNQR